MEVDATALTALIANPLVASIGEDKPVPPTLTQSVPLIKADQAWTAGYTGSGWTVAILDTGVDKTHSFIGAGKVVAEACFSTTSSSDHSTTVCPNGLSSQTGSGAGVNCVGQYGTAIYGCDHGTHVAGIAAGKDGIYSGNPINGVAKDANIIAIQIFSRFTGTDCTDSGYSSPCAYSWTSDQDLALEHVYALRTTYNIAAVNMSIGGGRYYSNCDVDSGSTKAAIDTLRAVGIATVISSGNGDPTTGIGYCDSICSPACISTAVSVGATTKTDVEAGYNNFHPTMLSLFSPGSSITSSIPGGGWGIKSGTSMAAPHVTGAWAILKQKSPGASVTEILNSFKTTGVLVTTGCGTGVQKPRIDVLAALSLFPNPVPAITSLSPASATAGGDAFTLTVNGSNFVGTSVVRWNGADLTTSFVSVTQLTAAVTAADIATGANVTVTVFNQTPDGGLSDPPLNFTVNNP